MTREKTGALSGFAAYTFVAIALVFALVLVLPPGDAHGQANTVSFSNTSYTREIPENTAANTTVGNPVRATDADGDTLTHSLGGTDADSFDIISSSGRIQTKVGVTYDYEAKSSYSVTVTADDGKGGTASTTVTINLTDVDEPPLPPPLVDGVGVPGAYQQVSVRWTTPDDTGRPPVTGYDVQYGDWDESDQQFVWIDVAQNTQATQQAFTTACLDCGHPVRVRAKSDEGDSPWAVIGGLFSDFDEEDLVPVFPNFPPTELELTQVRFLPQLEAGDHFRLLFVTNNLMTQTQEILDAQAADTTPYIEFTRLQAQGTVFSEGGHLDLFSGESYVLPLISSKLVDARELTNTTYTNDDKGVPIYWTDGTKVADDYEDFYDGDWDSESNLTDQSIRPVTDSNGIWTGSAADGTELVVSGVSHAMGQPQVGYGSPASTAPSAGPIRSGSTAANTELRRLYGLTDVFVVLSPSTLSNLDQPSSVTDTSSNRRSQRFTTGPHIHGYERIGVKIDTDDALYCSSCSFFIYTVDGNGHPDTQLAEFISPIAVGQSTELTFGLPDGTVLDPDTTYSIVAASNIAGQDVNLDTTSSNNEDSDTKMGWSIADAFDVEGGGSWSADSQGRSLRIQVRATPKVGPPAKPTGLTATAAGRNHINLSWTAPTMDGGSEITGYKIESSPDDSGWTDLVANTGNASTTYGHTGLQPNSTRYYRVSALNVEGASDPSDTAHDTTDDYPEVAVQFGQDDQDVGEGETVNVTIRLSADPERTVVIPVTSTPQGMASTSDYIVPTSVTFNDGDTEKTIPFMAVNDEEDDDDESVKLGFGSSLPSRVTAGARTETTLNIVDDDDPEVTVQFGQDAQGVGEGETVNVTVRLSADPERTVVIPVTSTPQGMASTSDYTVPTSVTFNDGETEQTIPFMAVNDEEDDDEESVKLGFGSGLPSRVTAGTRTETTLNIGDDDDPVVVVQFGASAYTVAESDEASTPNVTENEVVVTVTLDKNPERTIIIPITPTPVGTASVADYSGVPPSVTFNTGDTSATFTFTATEDVIDDDGEGVKLEFGVMPDPRVSAGTTDETTISITDDDTTDTVLNPTALTVTEGQSADYAVSLDTEPTLDVTVTITGHSGTDLTLSETALTFTSDDWDAPQTVTVTAAHDNDLEDDVVTLTHTLGGRGAYEVLTKTLPVTIDDNTGGLRLVDGQLTDPGNGGNPSEGRLEVYHSGEWCTICNDYWSVQDADVACRQLGFVGGAVEDWGRFRSSFFPTGARDQVIALDDVKCQGTESGLAECENRGWRVHNCNHNEDVGLRCIRNSEGPYITGMAISGPPGGNGRYDAGETVTVTVTWSEAVDVDVLPPTSPTGVTAPPHLRLTYGRAGGPRTKAVYSGGTGTDTTVFTATVEDRDNGPYTRIDVLYESLSTEIWNATPGQDPVGSHITSVATDRPAILGHGPFRGPESGSGQRAEATPASIAGVPSFNGAGDDGVFGSGEAVEVTFTFDRQVLVDTTGGTPSVPLLLSGTTTRQAMYLRGSGSSLLVFGYTLVDADGEHSYLLVDPNTLSLNGGAIRDTTNNLDADISHQGGGAVYLPREEVGLELQSAAVDGAALTLTYNAVLDSSVTLPASAFAVSVNGKSRSVDSASVSGSAVTLTLASAVAAGDTVTVGYTRPEGPSFIRDTLGRTADSFSGEAVTNSTVADEPQGQGQPAQTSNTPATGVPTITGKTQVGETLTADTSGISDADGLTSVSYAYRWLADDADIQSARSSSYILAEADEGKTVKVRVSFTDDSGNEESLTSAATAEVKQPLTASVSNVPASHNGSAAIKFELRFSETPKEGFSYKTLREHAFTVTGGSVTGARRLEPPGNVRWEISVSPSGGGDVTIMLPITSNCNAQGAICTGDGRMLSNLLKLIVKGP